MIDWKAPLTISVISLISSFIIIFIILFFVKPSFVMNKDKDGNMHHNWVKLIIYSLLFSIVIAIVAFLLIPRNKYNSFDKKNIL